MIERSNTWAMSVTEAALRENNWRISALSENEEREGHLQNGFAVVDQGHPGRDEEHRFASVNWARNEDGEVYFFNSVYDLSFEDAMRMFASKIGTEIVV